MSKTTLILSDYLQQRGVKVFALTRSEAEVLGINYPLESGWLDRYGGLHINDILLKELTAARSVSRKRAKKYKKRVIKKLDKKNAYHTMRG